MNQQRMADWKQKLGRNESAWDTEKSAMDKRDQMYRGTYTFEDLTTRDDAHSGESVTYVYNALAENIEAQVSNDIPMPKVTARRKQDEHLAVIIENMIRNEMDRISFERINDISERVVPIQGAGMYMVEWDNTKRTHSTVGEVAVSFIHPKRLVPQDGVYDGIEEMDYFFLKVPTTKEAIKARYGVDVSAESESEPNVKTSGDGEASEDMVTQIVVYYRNENGGIGKYSWVNDVELEDLEDYQARRLTRCGRCGAVEPLVGEIITDGVEEPVAWTSGGACPFCGASEWKEAEEKYEEIDAGSITRSDGSPIPGTEEAVPAEEIRYPYLQEVGDVTLELDMRYQLPEELSEAAGEPGTGEKWKIPYYKPNLFPLVLQRNVSVFGRLMGESDAEKLAPLQHGLNRMEQKIFDRFLKAGTKIGLPSDTNCRVDANDNTILRFENVADVNMVRAFNFVGDVTQEMAQVQAIYQQMRQTVGVTDSFQGRRDTTATSGTAKQFAAAQTAGRLESKRVQKEAAYAELFERIFKYRLAYADEPRPVVYQNGRGETVYDQFNKWDFLERDEAGDFWWNDLFLFSCDPTAPLASNRERMWQETTAMLQAGGFGNPTELETMVEYWRKMEVLHYPGAGETRANLQLRLDEQRQAAMVPPTPEGPTDEEVEEMARQAAMEDAGQSGGADLSREDIEELARQAAMQDAGRM